jgi:hypothetical protein
MKHEDGFFEDEADRLRYENELKKMKLSLEKGAVFSNLSNDEELPPEVENEFLKNIEAFERAHDEAKRITVYDFIGKPEYRKAAQIADDEIAGELETVLQLLNDNEIALDTLCEVDDRTLYSFVTDELFLHEIDDVRMEGWVSNFIYEEFHPNHEYDLINYSTDFIQSFLDKSSDLYHTHLTKEAGEDKSLRQFRDSFKSFILEDFEIISVVFDDEKANTNFRIAYSGIIEDAHEEQCFRGEGNFDFKHMYGYWYLYKVNFPPIT